MSHRHYFLLVTVKPAPQAAMCQNEERRAGAPRFDTNGIDYSMANRLDGIAGFYLAFFTLNAGAKLYGQMKTPMRKSPAATQLAWWGRSIFVMLGGLFLVVLIEYIPFFMGIGPGADILFTSTFGGPFMSILILLIPQFMVFFFLSTYLYRRTGRVYVGSFVVAMLACWVVTGGSAMF